MIRIDEIYYNVFVKAVQERFKSAFYWFDPFGSKRFEDLVSYPQLNDTRTRIIFWDQEPLMKQDAELFFDKFCDTYRPPIDYKDLRNRSRIILVTSEINSEDLNHIVETYKLDATYHYFFHGWAALDWYRGYNHSFLIKPWLARNFEHPLFIPNNIIGGKRKHRIELLAALASRDCVHQNLISFPDICPYEKVSAYQLAHEMGLDISKVRLPLTIDQNKNHSHDSHKIDFWDQASKCFCHVVTETVFSGRLHLTEKTFKPIVMQQPFILVGSRNALQYLRSYGFKTFGEIWDESYDGLPDDQRLAAIADLCRDISRWDKTKITKTQQQVSDIVEHNHRWFYGNFQDVLWKELNDMMDQWL